MAIFTLVGSIVGGCICVGAFWIIGTFFGPFYQGEADMARNVKIFLVTTGGAIILGAYLGYRFSTRRMPKTGKHM